MTKPFKIRVFYLVTELLAHTFVVLGALYAAGTIAACMFKSFLYLFYKLFIGIECHFHFITSNACQFIIFICCPFMSGYIIRLSESRLSLFISMPVT